MKTYDKYKDSKIAWLGKIPEHWGDVRLASCFSEAKDTNKDREFDRAFQFKYGSIVYKKDAPVDAEAIATFKKYAKVNENDIVVNGLNLNYDFLTQRVAIVPQRGIITSAYITITPKEIIVPKFACYLLKGIDEKKLLNGMGTGIRLTLSFGELKKQYIPYPNVAEQEQIVRYLDWKVAMADKFVREKRREITLLKELRQAEINRAVTRGLDPTAPTKPSGIDWIGDIPQHWKVRNFNHHFIFGKGLPITKKDLIEDGIEVISYGQIHSKLNNTIGLNKELVRYVNPSYLETNPQSLLTKGDFVFADTSEDQEGSGNNIYIDTDNLIFAGYHTVVARPVNIDNSEYVAYLFQSECWKRQIKNAINGVKVFSITKAILRKTKILFPTPCEQQQIAEHIKTIEANINKAIEKIENEIALTAEYKTRLISDVTTGKVDVRGIQIPDYTIDEESIASDNEETDE